MLRLRNPFHCVAALAPACLLLSLLTTACGRHPRSARHAPLPPPTASPAPTPAAPPPAVEQVKSVEPSPGTPQLSDAERKAAARAAFSEGVQLQEQNDCAHALARFEIAQRMFEAPTHLLHMAECQATTGRLLEAQESYATLSHLTLAPQAPAAFREAQETGRAEATRLKARVPTLRLETNPASASLKNLLVQINGTQLPSDLVGVTRPMNPGRYHVTMTAGPGRSASGDVEIKEGETKSLELRFTH